MHARSRALSAATVSALAHSIRVTSAAPSAATRLVIASNRLWSWGTTATKMGTDAVAAGRPSATRRMQPRGEAAILCSKRCKQRCPASPPGCEPTTPSSSQAAALELLDTSGHRRIGAFPRCTVAVGASVSCSGKPTDRNRVVPGADAFQRMP
eukprot:CAMPEP_0202806596 /NCGR_PEP_ID=MMETSP1388-20130828/104716_1 /ASSEMBLY_ACC=CAM_ASM_000864 /TAXON_ID=37098 /ORGANISM="Isochrysis sp, Strain CCMP1244" /LENGTH=152 /DNA_ID=CAMNT_0049476585 /DNA_START=541 /DNA_END=995 /DNA_ORIENTATION=+